jgi:hypothetical protein
MDGPEGCAATRSDAAMTDLRNDALRIAAALQAARTPEPLGVDLWSQSPDSAARLIELVIEECGDAGVPLVRVRVDPRLAVAMGGPPAGQRWSYRSCVLEADAVLLQRVEFHRFP